MWTEEEINEYTVYLDRQEKLVLEAITKGAYTLDQVSSYVKLKSDVDVDFSFIESVYTTITAPDKRVLLKD